MYLALLKISNFRCFSSEGIEFPLRKGLNVLVGENDAGKTAIIDAIRFVLGTSDQERIRIQETDFFKTDVTKPIEIVCKFEGLSPQDQSAFLEYLTYDKTEDGNRAPVLFAHWSVAKTALGPSSSKVFYKTEMVSGRNGDGPSYSQETRELLRATYLRPLRDADNSLTAGRNSRLSQVLQNIDEIKSGTHDYQTGDDISKLSIAGIASLSDNLFSDHVGISSARSKINETLNKQLALKNDALQARISVGTSDLNVERRLRMMLEKLNLDVRRPGCDYSGLGLGTSNLLYMACELLLLEQSKIGNRMLIVEEPEAHLHAQRQVKIMKSLQEEANATGVQVFLTTHSPLLCSVVHLENLILVQNAKAYPLGVSHTLLSRQDYRFLERFLDATKANLFFAKGVVIVEGDAENILLPTIARLINRDFTNYGVSVVNVGGTGLRRFSRIFQRQNASDEAILIPVACITDLDIMPDCAPSICKEVDSDPSKWPLLSKRKWRAVSDFSNNDIEEKRKQLAEKCDGQMVKTFIADNWTFEYDLSAAGLGKEVFLAAKLAIKDESNVPAKKSCKEVYTDSIKEYESTIAPIKDKKILASTIYSCFTKGTSASKAITAQYLSFLLEKRFKDKASELVAVLPNYILGAIEHVTEKF